MNLKFNIEHLEQALIKDEIHYQKVADIIFNQNKKPWHTSEWKELRDSLLKKSCEECGTEDGTLVLQHLWHPQKYSTIQYEVTGRFINEHFKQALLNNKETIDNAFSRYIERNLEYRDLCPQCQSINFKARKTRTPVYRCNKCFHEFDDPFYGEYLQGLTRKEAYRSIADKMVKDIIRNEHNEKIRRLSILESIRQHKRYISCEDTKTFCKKCAFLWDQKGMKLCEQCKTHYTNKNMSICTNCRLS